MAREEYIEGLIHHNHRYQQVPMDNNEKVALMNGIRHGMSDPKSGEAFLSFRIRYYEKLKSREEKKYVLYVLHRSLRECVEDIDIEDHIREHCPYPLWPTKFEGNEDDFSRQFLRNVSRVRCCIPKDSDLWEVRMPRLF